MGGIICCTAAASGMPLTGVQALEEVVDGQAAIILAVLVQHRGAQHVGGAKDLCQRGQQQHAGPSSRSARSASAPLPDSCLGPAAAGAMLPQVERYHTAACCGNAC